MKKVAITIAAVAATSLAAYSQGLVYVDNILANGYVVTSANSDSSSSVDNTYALAANFTVQLFGLSGNVQSTSGVTGLDAYNFLNPANLISDGFVAASPTIAGGSGGSQSSGVFSTDTAAAVPGSAGQYPFVNGNPGSTVVALVAWTGNYADFASAYAAYQTGSAYLGIIAFEQQLGNGGLNPTPDISSGWGLIPNSPNANANGGNQDLILTTSVPEPTSLALAGLGGFGMLMALRRKQA